MHIFRDTQKCHETTYLPTENRSVGGSIPPLGTIVQTIILNFLKPLAVNGRLNSVTRNANAPDGVASMTH
jgi:hypothetical protein